MRRRQLGLMLSAGLVLLFTTGCLAELFRVVGSGTIATTTRDVGAFTAIEFLGAGRIEITIGELKPLELTGDDNVLPLIETKVTNGRLVVRPTRPIRITQPLTLKATVPALAAITLSGAGAIVATGLDSDSLQIEVTGAGSVSLAGQTASLSIVLTGAGSVDAATLVANAATVNVSGAGSAFVDAVETLDVTITGVGSVTYSGEPTITQNITGLGSLKRATP